MAGNYYELEKKGTYRLRYKGKSKNITATSPRDVERQMAKFITEVDSGDFTQAGNVTFKKFAGKWLTDYAEVELAPKTIFRYKQMLESRIYPVLGDKKLGKVKPLDLLDFYKTMRKEHKYLSISADGTQKEMKSSGLSEKTIRHHHGLISAIFEKAIKWGVFDGLNPAKRVDAPKVEKKKAACYDESQVESLLAALENIGSEEMKYKTVTMIGLMTGARLGEIMGLEWQDIDFTSKVIEIRQASQYLPGEGTFTKAPKTEKSKRKLSVNNFLLAILAQYQQDQQGKGFICRGNNRLFVTWAGKPMHPNTITKWFPAFLQRHKLPKLSFHGLRHTSATFLISRGMDVQTVAGRLGHSTSATTQNIYSHFLESKDRQAADLMEDAFAKPEKTTANLKKK